MTASQRSPSSRAWPRTRSGPVSDSRVERLTFLRLLVFVAEGKTLISWQRPWLTSALRGPRSLGMSTETETSSGRSMRASTSSASASWGMTSSRTKLVASMRRRPVRMSASMSATLSSVATTSGSFWKPSRGPTSRMRTLCGRSDTATVNIYSPPLSEPIAIIGATGALGFGLTLRWGRAGVPIVLGSRDADRAVEAAERARAALPEGDFEGFENAEAATKAEVVVLCVPFRNQSETLTNLKGALRDGQLVVDATVPLAAAVSGRATRMLGVWQGSAAQQALEMVPDGVRVVSALHTVSAATLGDLDHALDEDVLICGDRKADKAEVAGLVEKIEGLRPVDAGRLEQARIVETLTALMIGMNARYKTHAGVRVTGLPAELWPRS